MKFEQILGLFCNLVALSLGQNCVKVLRAAKIVNEIGFQGVWCELETKKCFQRKAFTKYLRTTLTSM